MRNGMGNDLSLLALGAESATGTRKELTNATYVSLLVSIDIQAVLNCLLTTLSLEFSKGEVAADLSASSSFRKVSHHITHFPFSIGQSGLKFAAVIIYYSSKQSHSPIPSSVALKPTDRP